jgi:hypothetical protein
MNLDQFGEQLEQFRRWLIGRPEEAARASVSRQKLQWMVL